jgi:hypothetical protein
MMSRIGPSSDPEADVLMMETALSERDSGWLSGPFTEAEMTSRHGSLWLAARRFSIIQSGKFRQIDDFSAEGHNSTVWTDEKIPLGGVDEIVVLAKTFAGAVSDTRSVQVGDLQGRLHDSWSLSEARQLLGKVVDLKSAYKQLVRRRADSPFSTIALWDPFKKQACFFDSVVLPFGSTGSVFRFNRVSAAVKYILEHIGCLATSAFFDDFTVLELGKLAESAEFLLQSSAELAGLREINAELTAEISSSRTAPVAQGIG